MAFPGPRPVRSSSSKSLRTSLTSFLDAAAAAAAALPVSRLQPVFHSSCLASYLLCLRFFATVRHLASGSPPLNRTVQIQSRVRGILSLWLPRVFAAMKLRDALSGSINIHPGYLGIRRGTSAPASAILMIAAGTASCNLCAVVSLAAGAGGTKLDLAMGEDVVI